MDAELLHIDDLQLRIPGLARDEARLLGEEVARRLADRLPRDVSPRKLGALDLCLTLPWEAPRDRLAEMIVASIIERLA